MRMKALITGANGQDGWYLSRLLLLKGYEVYGLVRRSSQAKEVPEGVHVIFGDITEGSRIRALISEVQPDEIYNLAAQSHVGHSFEVPAHTFQVNTIGALNVMENAYRVGAKLYQASTSEMFGNQEGTLNEDSPLKPVSPYGAAKTAAHHLVEQYRSRGLFACAGILFNHESPRRGADFVTQHVARSVARVRCGLDRTFRIGNLSARRDWGHAEDYVRAMWMMLQQPTPQDYVIATGVTRSVRELVQAAWGRGWECVVVEDESRMRPVELHELRANPARAKHELGWEPTITFEQTVAEMVQAATTSVLSTPVPMACDEGETKFA